MKKIETGEIRPFMVMEVLEKALELQEKGRSIIHMEIGEPDFPTPKGIIDAGIASLGDGDTHYTDSRGVLALRVAVAESCSRKYKVEIDPSRVLITMGVSPALLLVLSSLIEQPGDEVILGDPCYPCYPNFVRYLGGTPRFIPTEESAGFQLISEDVEKKIGPRTRAIMVNSPSNPTGTLIDPAELESICRLGPPVVSDEIYHGLVYGQTERSAIEFSDSCYVLNGFSKLYAMTGWRLGYIIMPEKALRDIQILQQNFFISPSSFVQQAGIAALDSHHDEVDAMIEEYDRRRRYLLERLPRLGLDYLVEPKGAFYIFVNASHLGRDSHRLAFDILQRAGVALTPGIDFGQRGEGHLRISYANSLENIREGLDRLERYIKGEV